MSLGVIRLCMTIWKASWFRNGWNPCTRWSCAKALLAKATTCFLSRNSESKKTSRLCTTLERTSATLSKSIDRKSLDLGGLNFHRHFDFGRIEPEHWNRTSTASCRWPGLKDILGYHWHIDYTLDWWMISPSGFINILNRREEDIIKCSIPHKRNLRRSHFLCQYWLELDIKQCSPISNSKQLVKKNTVVDGTESHWEIKEPFWL